MSRGATSPIGTDGERVEGPDRVRRSALLWAGPPREHEGVTATVLHLPLEVETDTHDLDALTTHAVRLALEPERSMDELAGELCAAAHGSARLLDAAIARVDRAVAAEWSRTGTRALTALEAARDRLRGR